MISAYSFWQRVDQLRGDRTLKEIAEKFGLNYATIKDMRTKDRYPKLDVLVSLADSLGVSLDYLITGNERQLSSPEARYVEEHPEARALVRAVMRDPALLSALSAVIVSSEKIMNDRKGS